MQLRDPRSRSARPAGYPPRGVRAISPADGRSEETAPQRGGPLARAPEPEAHVHSVPRGGMRRNALRHGGGRDASSLSWVPADRQTAGRTSASVWRPKPMVPWWPIDTGGSAGRPRTAPRPALQSVRIEAEIQGPSRHRMPLPVPATCGPTGSSPCPARPRPRRAKPEPRPRRGAVGVQIPALAQAGRKPASVSRCQVTGSVGGTRSMRRGRGAAGQPRSGRDAGGAGLPPAWGAGANGYACRLRLLLRLVP